MTSNASDKDAPEVNVAETFRQRLVALRMEKAVSRETVSELCGLAPNAIRRYERGQRIPGAISIARLADFYGVSTDYLLGLTDSRQKNCKNCTK